MLSSKSFDFEPWIVEDTLPMRHKTVNQAATTKNYEKKKRITVFSKVFFIGRRLV